MRAKEDAVVDRDVAGDDSSGFARGVADDRLADLRDLALDVVAAGIQAADPAAAVDRLVDVDSRFLRAGGRCFDLDAVRSIVLLGAGKASLPIVTALESKLGERITDGLVVRRRGSNSSLGRVRLIEADHPVPTTASLDAGRALVGLAEQLGPGDLAITAFTGGSSALACLPPDGVSFSAKQQLHSLLLDSGARISEINTVRKHVSALKGGRLAARLNGATILNLTVSDVVGDSTDLLCDATVQDTTDQLDAIAVLDRFGLWSKVAAEVRRHLDSPQAASPLLTGADITTIVLVTGSSVVEAMAARVRSRGIRPEILGSNLEGDAASLGGFLGSLARESSLAGRPFARASVLVAAGGEATVSIRRSAGDPTGSGGPNQEAALGFARAVAGKGVFAAGAFVDSDGSDGGTEAAGGCVDSSSAARAERLRVDIGGALAHHDSTAALERLGDLVTTGPTGTNVSDIWAVAIGPGDLPDGAGETGGDG